jgi:T3SS negative regulator,GrlR
MLDGLWIVRYHGPTGVGGGVVIFTNGKIMGGDSGFVYTGTYEEKSDNLTSRVCAVNFDPNVLSVLGVPGDHDLLIEGKIKGDTINGTGALVAFPDTKIAVQLTKFPQTLKLNLKV